MNSFCLSQLIIWVSVSSIWPPPSIRISGFLGSSYGSLIPVNSLMTPLRARA